MKIKKKDNAVRVPPLKKPIKIKRTSADSKEDSTVQKALENVKKVLEKKKKAESAATVSIVKKSKADRFKKLEKDRQPRGIVYVGHVPHGFYEEQMRDYFKQFGKVTRVRVARSKNTGKSRGYGYVEFQHPDVAKIAAETMNNYLMCGRLLKATYIAPEKQHARFFVGKAWRRDFYPKLKNRRKITAKRNSKVSDQVHKNFVKSTKDKLSALEKKLKEKGFDLKFSPVDDPEV